MEKQLFSQSPVAQAQPAVIAPSKYFTWERQVVAKKFDCVARVLECRLFKKVAKVLLILVELLKLIFPSEI